MTAIIFTDDQEDRALAVAKSIGAALRNARETRGETLREAASAIDSWDTTVGHLERGDAPNPKLGTIVKLLDHYGLEVLVVPKHMAVAMRQRALHEAIQRRPQWRPASDPRDL